MTNVDSNNRTSNVPVATPVQRQLTDIPLTPNTPIVGTIISEETMDLNPNMIDCLRKAQVVNIFCAVDIIFGFIYSLYYPLFFIPILCSLTGYFGSKKFNKQLILLYITFLIFNIIFRIINFTYNILSIDYKYIYIEFLFFILLFIFESIITIYVLNFYNLLKKLQDLEIRYLRTNINVQKKFICNC